MESFGGPTGAGSAPVEPIRVLIVDDHALFRRGLDLTLQQEPDINVVGEASDGGEAVRQAVELLPDVILLDLRMPRRDGIEACAAIHSEVPSAKLVILTTSDEEADLFDAVKAGASGYLVKTISVDEIASAVRDVHGGKSLIPPSMASKLLNEFATIARRAEETRQLPPPRLTEREMEVLKLVARGMSNRDIATKLTISENTVKNHVRNILDKLQLHSRMQAAMYAVRTKLFDTE
ncbi:MAG: response regulator transcription factor [Streptosporangiales bacterium]|nr:response regulator transcription factor [Streptosporangiales bacterium]MBO0892426.1 response regulator transcription factor [Acidothermales bacterium]